MSELLNGAGAEVVSRFSQLEQKARELAIRGKGNSKVYLEKGEIDVYRKFAEIQDNILMARPGELSDEELSTNIDFMQSELTRLGDYDSGERSL
ncbi:MAG: hypothetical protein NTY30_03270 [Candidatus Berkelbacteria bacterium]|nr:hypothetical protein [Candidatus Berkelbacteria bacterium]